MQTLLPAAEKIANLLKARKETLAIAESSTGGLVCATLLAQPGASAYFIGGAVIYTVTARATLLGITADHMQGLRPATEPYAKLLAATVRARHGSTWGLGETGATGPTGNRYGDAAGHYCIAVSGPHAASVTLETASADRQANMRSFAEEALAHLLEAIQSAGGA